VVNQEHLHLLDHLRRHQNPRRGHFVPVDAGGDLVRDPPMKSRYILRVKDLLHLECYKQRKYRLQPQATVRRGRIVLEVVKGVHVVVKHVVYDF
jgi:hypothetical protein